MDYLVDYLVDYLDQFQVLMIDPSSERANLSVYEALGSAEISMNTLW